MRPLTVEPNLARRAATETFRETLRRLKRRSQVTERDFANEWLAAMSSVDGVSMNGWYNPPPDGVAVLTGIPRINFTSLRDEENWPSTRTIDWENGALYAYCSPVNTASGMPGDFAITLYFGDNKHIRQHFHRTYQAVHEILTGIPSKASSGELFRHSTDIFDRWNLRNCVISYTDTVFLDLGHTFPALSTFDTLTRKLEPAEQDFIRRGRKFINNESDWPLNSHGQFTVEPQLIDVGDAELPQVTYHYVVTPDSFGVLDDQDTILTDFGLVP